MRLRGSSAGKKPFLVTLKEDRSSSNPSCCVTAWGDIVKGTHSGHLEELLYRGEGEREREREIEQRRWRMPHNGKLGIARNGVWEREYWVEKTNT